MRWEVGNKNGISFSDLVLYDQMLHIDQIVNNWPFCIVLYMMGKIIVQIRWLWAELKHPIISVKLKLLKKKSATPLIYVQSFSRDVITDCFAFQRVNL